MAMLARPLSGGDTPACVVPSLTASSRWRQRLLDMLPLTLSIFLISTIVWGPYLAPWVFAVGITVFFIYWLLRSYGVAVTCWIGLRRVAQWERTNWVAKYCAWLPKHPDARRWDWPRHMVIVPNYKESDESLSRTLDSLAAQANAQQLVVVMAMEAREPGSRAKASRLLMRYRRVFGDMMATYHPAGLPGETPGKGSNEAWAARQAYIRLIENAGDEIERYTLTSCDADALFDPHHFEALNYLFLTARRPYRTFWEPVIFNTNNIWDIPAPLRVPDGLSGINRLSNLLLPGSVKFPTSCYSTSWRMVHEVDYWDEEVIPEDWHLFLKCCFALGDDVHCEALFLRLGNDCVLTSGYAKTMRGHYAQAVRHAWGASDLPYAWRAVFSRTSPLSIRRRLVLAAAVTKVHVLWFAQWYLVTLGVLLPAKLAGSFGAPLPYWWSHLYPVPGPGWHPENIVRPWTWLTLGKQGLVEPVMWLNLCGIIIAFCILPLIAMVIFDHMTRPPRPAYVSRKAFVGQFTMWPLMAPITFLFASLPAASAQWRLASGRGLAYHVAEKGTRESVRPMAPLPAGEPAVEPVVAIGGE